MAILRTYPLANSAILRLNSERQFINVKPTYQRKGDIWTLEKKQLLVDSILNDYDIPKLYFHALSPSQKKVDMGRFDYAIIDGRQRVETLWGFIDDSFALADDFVYFADKKMDAASLTYSQLADKHPRLKIRFDSYSLPIVCVETEDIDLIEDMFSRLNEAVPLNAAEKRSALGGPMAKAIVEVAEHPFFVKKVRFSDKRYQHREVAARLLFLEFSRMEYGRIVDTKKPYLDQMVIQLKDSDGSLCSRLARKVVKTLDLLNSLFHEQDMLLRAQGAIPVFYLTAQTARRRKGLALLGRKKIEEFYDHVRANRELAETDMSQANFEWLEFDRMSQQGTNDAASIKERARILEEFLGLKN